jgi:hypothetical protein
MELAEQGKDVPVMVAAFALLARSESPSPMRAQYLQAFGMVAQQHLPSYVVRQRELAVHQQLRSIS